MSRFLLDRFFPLLLTLPLMGSCKQELEYRPDKDTGEADADTDSDTDADTDTDPPDDDLDGDGFTAAEGDCDDDDIYVNPARDEDPDDGKDNDCDGRTDEEWSGLTVAYYDYVGDIPCKILTLDTVGRLTREQEINTAEVYPMWIDHGLDGVLLANNAQSSVVIIDESGDATTLLDLSESEDYTNGVYGVATHPDGYYLVTTLDALLRVEPDGSSFTELARWSIDTADPPTYDLTAYTIAVNPKDGEVGLFGYYGGFATYSDTTGWQKLRPVDVENWDGIYTYSGAYRDSKGWYSLKFDGNTGAISMSRFSTTDNDWVEKATWEESAFFPSVLTINGDEGDFYVTSNAGNHATVWRMLADGSQAGNFYDSTVPTTYADYRGFYGLVSNY